MTITINGSGTIGGLSAGGLPDATVQPADLSTGAPYWDTSGNLGVGTSSPASRFQAADASASGTTVGSNRVGLFSTSGTGKDVNITFSNLVDDNVSIGGLGGVMYFLKNSTERARIDSSGNLLVGTTSGPGERLAVVGASGYATGSFQVSANGNPALNFRNVSGTVAGSVVTGASTTSYNTSSDYRLKNTITPMTGALETVAQLKPCTYKWNADGSDGQGFIAHELQAVVPDCVTGEKDAVETYLDEEGNEQTRPKYQGIDTSFLVATLTAAIQEQQAIITQLQADVAALKGQG